MRWLFTSILISTIFVGIYAQSPYVLPGTYTDHVLQRLEIRYGLDNHSAIRNRSRDLVAKSSRLIPKDFNIMFSAVDKFDLQYLSYDNDDYVSKETIISDRELSPVYSDSSGVFYSYQNTDNVDSENDYSSEERKPILKYFYKSPAHFLALNTDNFTLRINPILNLQYGKASKNNNTIFQNTRGLEVRGKIDEKVYFYTSLLENQRSFNDYVDRRIQKFKAIPGNGSFKNYESSIIGTLRGYDYLNAQAYVGIRLSEAISMELGHGKHFIGNGIRSLLLSDSGHNYFYLKFNTRIWKFQYQNIFAELAPLTIRDNDRDILLPKKYMATHYLSFKPNSQLEIGLFETVIFGREDHFELQYLNPIIIYRTVEYFLGSPDNVMLGLNANWNFLNRFSLYGQLLLDELKIKEFTDGTGWWANKYGVQLGFKYINVLNIDHLDAQVEANFVRPYTYSHRDTLAQSNRISLANYSHFAQPLAHPLGANFKEIIGKLRYQPISKLVFDSRIMLTSFGDDNESDSWGGNILIPSDEREMDFGNQIGQGEKTEILLLGLDISYQIFHNYFIDLNILYRKADANLDNLSFDTKYIGGGVRINLGNYNLDY